MGAPPVRLALLAVLVVLALQRAAGQTTAPATATTAAATGTTVAETLWVMVPFAIKVAAPYDATWMTNRSSSEYQQLAANSIAAVTPPIDTELGESHMVSTVDRFEEYLDRIKVFINCTIKTMVTQEADVPLRDYETNLKDALRIVKNVGEYTVNGADVDIDNYEVVPPLTTTTVAQTTVREKRSTTQMETSSTVVESTAAATTTATEAPATNATTSTETTTATAEANTTTASANTTTASANTTTASANTTTASANTTTASANTTTVTTTTQPTTTEALPPVSAKLSCLVRITSLVYQDWMKLAFTSQYINLASTVERLSEPVLVDKFGVNFISVAVIGFRSGSVLVDMEVVVMTNKTRAEDVDAKALSQETTLALQNLYEEGDFIFDPEAVHTNEEIEIIEPTTPPAPTEDPYRHTIMRFEMRAPFANWTEELNDTDSDEFANMEKQVKLGVELMVSKKYPVGEWNVSTHILWMTNATVDAEEAGDDVTEPQGVNINFVITVEPQMTNTSKVVEKLARDFVYFNKLGNLQIAPQPVHFKDMTSYAPGLGVVVMDEDYLRKLRKSKYNGSYIGDYTTQPPTLRPVIKRHKGFVLGIAVPAFIGMIAAIGLLLICTTIAGAKKSDD